MLSLLGNPILDNSTFCSVLLAVFPTAQQFSIFVTAVLCLTRTIGVVRPMCRISKRLTFGSIGLYLGLLIARVVMLFMDRDLEASYGVGVMRCHWVVAETGRLVDFTLISLFLISLILTPSLVGCIVTLTGLLKPCEFPITATKRHATVTVVMLTGVCLAASSTFVVERILRIRGGAVSPVLENVALVYAYSFTCVANPTIYFTRLNRLQRFARAVFSGRQKETGFLYGVSIVTSPVVSHGDASVKFNVANCSHA